MMGFWYLTKRNLLIFFKDKQTILFSLLTSLIVLGLYLLFLKKTFLVAFDSAVKFNSGINGLLMDSDINVFLNFLLLSGVLGTAMITIPYNCLIGFVRDKEEKIDYDILATPIKRGQIIISYFVSASISSIILTGIILTIGLLVIGMQGDLYMNTIQILKAYGLVIFGSVSSTSLFMIVVLFLKSTSASSAFFGILSAVSGFAIGAYVPISQFSQSIQTICNILPASQITSILRNILMNGTLEHMNQSLNGVDKGMLSEHLRSIFSFNARVFNNAWNIQMMTIYVVIVTCICVFVQIIIYRKKYKKL